MAAAIEELFSQDFLKQLEGLSLLARQLARRSHRAERRAVERGVSPEFAEYRPYTPGDDTRYIDWHAFARWRHLVLKLFVEEHDLPVHLLVDCTASMDWGEPRKFDHARQVAAGLAYVALGNHDRVGLAPLSAEKGSLAFPADRGKDRFWPLLRRLAGFEVSPGPLRLGELVHSWLGRQPPRGLVVLVSDLWGADMEDAFDALDRLRYSRHEVAVVQITDGNELEAGPLGEYKLEGAEGGSRTVLVDRRVQERFRQSASAYQEKITLYCRKNGLPLLQAQTDSPVPDILLKMLRVEGFLA